MKQWCIVNAAMWIGCAAAIIVAIIITDTATPLWALTVPMLGGFDFHSKEAPK
jgi:hypothetical protein